MSANPHRPESDQPHPQTPDELPELREAVLGADELAALFSDLSTLAQILEVRQKRASGLADEHTITLASAHAALLAGTVTGVQVRYRHQAQTWCDTLLRLSDGFKLVRVALPD